MYHLLLIRGASYTGDFTATKKNPDVYTDSKAEADAAVASGFFKLIGEPEKAKKPEKVEESVETPKETTESAAAAPKSRKKK